MLKKQRTIRPQLLALGLTFLSPTWYTHAFAQAESDKEHAETPSEAKPTTDDGTPSDNETSQGSADQDANESRKDASSPEGQEGSEDAQPTMEGSEGEAGSPEDAAPSEGEVDSDQTSEDSPLPGIAPPEPPPPPAVTPETTSDDDGSKKKKRRVEQLYITGSRVRQTEAVSAAPVTVVDREDLDASGLVSVGDILQNLPIQSNAINVQFNNGGDGSTRVNLRGLGSNRTLVLLNGRRFVPGGTGANASVDLNTIPVEIIDRVEVFKDGASAAYGSDAIAGVVNIITKRDFSGLEASTYVGGTKAGGLIYNLGVTGGESGEKGGFFLSFQYYKQAEVMAGQRDYAKSDLAYDFETGEETREGSSAVPQGYIFDRTGAAGNTAWTKIKQKYADSDPIYFNDPSTGWRPFNFNGNSDTGDGDYYNYQPENYLMTPSQRISMFGAGQYDISDRVTAYFEATYTNRTSTQLLAPEPLFTIQEGLVVSRDNVYNPFGRDFIDIRRRLVEAGNRVFEQDLDTYRAVVGLNGNFPEELGRFSDWRWDANFVYGRTAGVDTNQGRLMKSRLQNALGPSYIDANGKAVCGTPDAPIDGCVPIDLFDGPGSITPEMMNYLTYVGVARGYTDQKVLSLEANGELFELFGRSVGLALGYQFRNERGLYTPDPLTAKGDTTGNKTESTGGEFTENAGYVELNLPLISDLPGAKLVEFNGQLRVFNFDTFGSDQVWKAGLRWQILDDIMVRGTYSRAFRTPSIGELYQGVADDFPAATDPCTAGSRNANQDANCKAQGIPDDFKDNETQIRTLIGGNPNLGPETAKIGTVGAVFTPKFADWAKNMSLSLDYFHIRIDNSIQPKGTTVILNNCYNAEPGKQSDCDLIVRDEVTHRIDYVRDLSTNIGGAKTSGIDLDFIYTYPTSVGRFRFNFEGSWLQQYKEYQPARVVDGKDVYDLTAVYPAIRFNSGLSWGFNGFGLGTNLRYIGPIRECEDNDCTERTADDGTTSEAPSRDVDANITVDLYGSYGFANAYGFTSVTAGINNVFDQDPSLIYAGFLANSDAGTYDFIGRYFYVGLRHQL